MASIASTAMPHSLLTNLILEVPYVQSQTSQTIHSYPIGQAFITQVGKCLPGDPIGNDDMEAYLGKVNGQASRVKIGFSRAMAFSSDTTP